MGGPREAPEKGFRSYPEEVDGPKLRVRAEKFADHYSQARQFYLSQTEIEQGHIAAAFVFELSKVETPAIRERMVSHLLNVDQDLARKVAEGLRLKRLPAPAEPARPPIMDNEPSPALSIVLNGPKSFAGRKLGILISDGVDAKLLAGLRKAAEAEGAVVELVAPMVGGVEASDGSWIEAKQKIDGGPSVLYDAVAILASEDGAAELLKMPPARDFLADAFAHLKFIAHVADAQALLDKAGVVPDGGVVALGKGKDVDAFIKTCRKLRVWEREPSVKQF
jgi:catalase